MAASIPHVTRNRKKLVNPQTRAIQAVADSGGADVALKCCAHEYEIGKAQVEAEKNCHSRE